MAFFMSSPSIPPPRLPPPNIPPPNLPRPRLPPPRLLRLPQLRFYSYSFLRRLLWTVLLIPLLNGTIFGVVNVYNNHVTSARRVRDFESETGQARRLGRAMMDFEGPPFYVPRLRSHNWLDKLNLTRWPVEPGTPSDIYTVGALPGTWTTGAHLRSHWVYVTLLHFSESDPWNAAFADLIQYHNAIPVADGASLSFLQYIGSTFLCDMWGVSYPALVHFNPRHEECVDNPAATTRQKVRADGSDKLCPVTTRAIELPLKSMPAEFGFPSYLQQMLSLTSSKSAYEAYPEHDWVQTQLKVWNEHLDNLARRHLFFRVLLRISDTLNGLPSPVGSILDFFETCGYYLGLILGAIGYLIGRPLYNLAMGTAK